MVAAAGYRQPTWSLLNKSTLVFVWRYRHWQPGASAQGPKGGCPWRFTARGNLAKNVRGSFTIFSLSSAKLRGYTLAVAPPPRLRRSPSLPEGRGNVHYFRLFPLLLEKKLASWQLELERKRCRSSLFSPLSTLISVALSTITISFTRLTAIRIE